MTPLKNKNTNDSTKQNLDWNRSYYLDIDLIDKQHAVFFKIFDELKELNKAPELYVKLKELIHELEKYTNIHFQTEEALLVKSNYAEIDMHIVQHQIFKRKIEDFKIAETYHNTVLIDQMIVFMRKWFLMHIAEIDRKYVDDVKQLLSKKKSGETSN